MQASKEKTRDMSVFFLTGFNFKIGSKNMSWIYAAESNRSISDEKLPPSISYLEKWKFSIWYCPMFAESRTVPNSTKIKCLITILLYAYSSLRMVVPPINYAWLNYPTIVLCFLDKVEAQFWLFVSACLLKCYFFSCHQDSSINHSMM